MSTAAFAFAIVMVLAACGSDEGTGRPLTQADAYELAQQAAIAYGTPENEVQGCEFEDASTAVCAVSIRFADNPDKPQTCVMQVRVWSVSGQSEGTQLQSGNYGIYEPMNQEECEAAREASGY